MNGESRMKIRPGIVRSAREQVEPAALADDVKHRHARGGATGAAAVTATNSSSRRPYSAALRAQSWRTMTRMIERVTTIALNIETSTPMIRTSAKPRMTDEPKAYRIVAVMRLDTFESRIEFQARLKPASTAAGSDLPTRSSSFIRSKIRMLASTAMPTESTKPAMPARVRVTGMSRKMARTTIV